MSVHGSRPTVSVETTSRQITAFGGAELLRETLETLGVIDTVDHQVGLKQRCRGLSEGEFVAAVAESIALGASCLDDLAITRADAAQTMLRGFEIPAPQTAGAWLRRFSLGHILQMDAALRKIIRRGFMLAGVEQVTLDFDSTYVFSRSKRREGADRTYKKGYALHPLMCFEANSGVAVHARLRRGRAGASTGIDTFVRQALQRIPEGVVVRTRMDSGFYSGRLFNQFEKAGVTYLCGVPLSDPIKNAAANVPDQAYEPCIDKDTGEVAEFWYRLTDSPVVRRYVVKRIPVRIGEQPTLDSRGYHYWVLVTNDHTSPAPDLESEHRHKADVENGMRELKSNFGMHAMRKHRFMANWAWLQLVCLGHNLCCWLQQLGGLTVTCDGAAMRAKRLRYRFLTVPALVVRTARHVVLKLRIDYPLHHRFVAALARIRALNIRIE